MMVNGERFKPFILYDEECVESRIGLGFSGENSKHLYLDTWETIDACYFENTELLEMIYPTLQKHDIMVAKRFLKLQKEIFHIFAMHDLVMCRLVWNHKTDDLLSDAGLIESIVNRHRE